MRDEGFPIAFLRVDGVLLSCAAVVNFDKPIPRNVAYLTLLPVLEPGTEYLLNDTQALAQVVNGLKARYAGCDLRIYAVDDDCFVWKVSAGLGKPVATLTRATDSEVGSLLRALPPDAVAAGINALSAHTS